MQTDKKICFFAARNVVTFAFIKVSFSGYLLAYGTAEAGEMITIFKAYLGGSLERGRQCILGVSLGGVTRYTAVSTKVVPQKR